jgi:TPR repeat protein
LFGTAAAPEETTTSPAIVNAATAGTATAPATKAAAAVMSGAVATPDSKTSSTTTPTTPGGVKAGVEAWQRGNYNEALADWRPLAEKGDPDAQFNLAQAYKLGRGVPVDLKQAESLYAKAAAQGHPEAQANLGIILFQNGDQARSMPYIIKAAQSGDARAQYIYGTALFNGDYLKKDWPRAYAMMTKAAAAGLPQAAQSLSKMDGFIPASQRQQGIALTSSGTDLKAGESTSRASPAARPPIGQKIAAAKPAPKQIVPTKPVTKPVAIAAAKPVARPAAKPTAIAAAKPIARPAAKPMAIPQGQGWYVQLGAYSSRAAAAGAWGSARGKVGALAGLSPAYSQAGRMTRLRAGPVNGKMAAAGLCKIAARAGQPCFPAAP